jgi:hypothetical protein
MADLIPAEDTSQKQTEMTLAQSNQRKSKSSAWQVVYIINIVNIKGGGLFLSPHSLTEEEDAIAPL